MIRQKYNNRYIKVRENRREWAIKGGQPRDLGDIWPHKTQEEDKHNTETYKDDHHGYHQHMTIINCHLYLFNDTRC